MLGCENCNISVNKGKYHVRFLPCDYNISKKALLDTNTPPHQKLPITAVILLLIHITLNFMLSFDFFFWAICLVAFYGTLASYIPK